MLVLLLLQTRNAFGLVDIPDCFTLAPNILCLFIFVLFVTVLLVSGQLCFICLNTDLVNVHVIQNRIVMKTSLVTSRV